MRTSYRSILASIVLLLFETKIATACVAVEVSTSDLDFGVYNPLAVTPSSESFSVTLSCITDPVTPSIVTPFRIGIDATAGDPAARSLRSGSEQLSYEIRSVTNGLSTWGPSNSTAVVTGIFESIVAPPDQTFHGTGTINARQDVPVGTYSDALMIVIEF